MTHANSSGNTVRTIQLDTSKLLGAGNSGAKVGGKPTVKAMVGGKPA